jgi:ABC-type transport system involved in cytochrome bd biosynthesis fused ATPase/permease subunit
LRHYIVVLIIVVVVVVVVIVVVVATAATSSAVAITAIVILGLCCLQLSRFLLPHLEMNQRKKKKQKKLCFEQELERQAIERSSICKNSIERIQNLVCERRSVSNLAPLSLSVSLSLCLYCVRLVEN